jgi:acetyl esterase/lipase
MSRHLVDQELAAGSGSHLPMKLDHNALAKYRADLIEMVAAIPRPMTDAMARLQLAERLVPGLEGDPDVRVLVYAPPEAATVPRPAMLYIHGGGFVCGSADMSDPISRSLAADMDCVVVSVDYRLASRFP